MKTLVERFYTEPVFALAVLAAVDTYLVSQHVIAAALGLVIGGVIALVQRQLVTPAKGKVDLHDAKLDDPGHV